MSSKDLSQAEWKLRTNTLGCSLTSTHVPLYMFMSTRILTRKDASQGKTLKGTVSHASLGLVPELAWKLLPDF